MRPTDVHKNLNFFQKVSSFLQRTSDSFKNCFFQQFQNSRRIYEYKQLGKSFGKNCVLTNFYENCHFLNRLSFSPTSQYILTKKNLDHHLFLSRLYSGGNKPVVTQTAEPFRLFRLRTPGAILSCGTYTSSLNIRWGSSMLNV